jgi:molybdenum cofactor cytidylyltransferase
MEFGPLPPDRAEGAMLAHSLRLGRKRLKKGLVLGPDEIAALKAAGLTEVTVARLGAQDMGENTAAAALAAALVPDPEAAGLRLSKAFTGRVNIHTTRTGLLQLDAARIQRINAVDPVITLATLPRLTRLREGRLVATVKIIAYGVAESAVTQACEDIGGALTTLPVLRRSASLVLTRTQGMEQRLFDKGRAAIARRLKLLGVALSETLTTPHETPALAEALSKTTGDMVLILTASATSDIRDTGPAALVAAGGNIIRYGLPVDPGNLLFLGSLGARPVIGLPGCARSLALNGADWVLERIACGLDLSSDDLAAMAVGGLLKEPPGRPQPREITKG